MNSKSYLKEPHRVLLCYNKLIDGDFMKKIIVITGPTATGKTKLSIELAKRLNGEIINADSTQIYKEINIGTAKITNGEKEGIIHHLIDIKNLNEEYTVCDYQKDAREKIEDIVNRGKTAIIVGGSGLYLNALLYDYKFIKGSNIFDIESLNEKEMYNKLIEKYPDLNIDKNNRQRLVRAYAKYINNSSELKFDNQELSLIYDCSIVGLTTEREDLYKKINRRVDIMIEMGLIKEVRDLYSKYKDTKQFNSTIGYKEFKDYIENKVELETVLTAIKQNSRNYAKRQYTWFNNKMNIKWFNTNYEDFNKTIEEVYNYLKSE